MAPSSTTPSETQDSPSDPLLGAVLRLISQDGVKVPPIPGVVARLSEHLSNPNFELRQVAQLVGTDQALSAHILRCASSTLLAARTQVTSLHDAVNRVGTNGLFSLAVSFSLGREVTRSSPLQSLRRDVFRNGRPPRPSSAAGWRRASSAEPEGAFLCGLLASFGLTVALGAIEQAMANQAEPSRPAEVVDGDGAPLRGADRPRRGRAVGHAEAGRRRDRRAARARGQRRDLLRSSGCSRRPRS